MVPPDGVPATEIQEASAPVAFSTEPRLDNLRALDKSKTSFKDMLRAADADSAEHAARMRKLSEAPNGSKTSQPSSWRERIDRKKKWDAKSEALKKEALSIIHSLNTPVSTEKGETHFEVAKERLGRWQKALELYVHCPEESGVDLLKLLEKLIEGCTEEEELLEVLSQASQTCTNLVEQTSLAVRDATESMAEAEDAYHIRLEAHTMLANRAAEQSEVIEEQFRTNGRAALKIGQQLEMAEVKKRQCDTAALLIRQWWMMENLAEQEELSGEVLQVDEELRGVIPSSSCRMDPLFTQPENSLEAARALKALRTVVKSRGNSASGALLDPVSRHRFDVTSRLIQRTSAALESRLINSFSEIYVSGGTYDFSSPEAASRPGRLNWVELRNLAVALSNFDGGRGLHKRYVQMVVTSRFPELFQSESNKNGGSSDEDNSDEEFELDMDAMRQKLSNLFHRVCEVCTAEFEFIANVFSSPTAFGKGGDAFFDFSSFSEALPFQVARALLQRVISDPRNGLQARINDLLRSIDRRGDFDAGTKKLDTFVVIHEKAAGLFTMLKDSAQKMLTPTNKTDPDGDASVEEYQLLNDENKRAVASLIQFLATQEMALSSSHRRGYLNLELRLLHHECCYCLDRTGAKLVMPQRGQKPHVPTTGVASGIATYVAPVMPLDKRELKKMGFAGLLNGPLKQSVLRQPLMHATDSLARARLMFGLGHGGVGDADSTARVITGIFSQMCSFYGSSFIFPIIEVLGQLLDTNPPSSPPSLPFDESSPAPDLGVDGSFWVSVERIHSAAKAFDRELWAEQRTGSERVWEILVATGSHTSLILAKDQRLSFFQELEERGETAILRALDTLSTHIQWVLVAGGEMSTGNRIRGNFNDKSGGPYAVPAGSSLDNANSPAVKSLTFCLRAQFVHIQAALTPQSLSAFWTALSMRLYDILVARLLQHYFVSMVGAVNLSRDVEALRSVAMLAGTDHQHWDMLRELLTLYMTPPNALKTILVGPEGDPNSGKGLFGQAGKDQALIFMSRRVDYRVKVNNVLKKSTWAVELLEDLGVPDPTDGNFNIALYSAQSLRNRRLKLT